MVQCPPPPPRKGGQARDRTVDLVALLLDLPLPLQLDILQIEMALKNCLFLLQIYSAAGEGARERGRRGRRGSWS
jgi:hypothetical protein